MVEFVRVTVPAKESRSPSRRWQCGQIPIEVGAYHHVNRIRVYLVSLRLRGIRGRDLEGKHANRREHYGQNAQQDERVPFRGVGLH